MSNHTTATSIVDFLKARQFQPTTGEKFPLFEQRTQLFGALGLTQQLGDFRGSAEQNTALLNQLTQREKDIGVSITPENIFDIIGTAQQTAQELPVPPEAVDTQIGQEVAGVPAQLPEDQQQIPEALQGLVTSARGAPVPSVEELTKLATERFTGSTGFALQQEAVGADKTAIRLAAQRDTEDFIRGIASRGLFFSGQKKTGITSIETDKLASLLGIDRSFAKIVAEGLERSAQDIVKEAQKGGEDAIKALDKLGFVLSPDGILIQKPSERRAEESGLRAAESAERAGRTELRSIETAERAARSELRSIESAERAQRSLDLSFARFSGEESRRNSVLNADINDYLNGVIGLDEVSLENRDNVIKAAETFLNTEVNSIDLIGEKLRVSNDIGAPITFTDEELRLFIYDDFTSAASIETVRSGINSAPIVNRDRANLIADEIYGIGIDKTESSEVGGVIDEFIPEGQGTDFGVDLSQGFETGLIDFSKIRFPSAFRY